MSFADSSPASAKNGAVHRPKSSSQLPPVAPYPRRIGFRTTKPIFTNASLAAANFAVVFGRSVATAGEPWLMTMAGNGPSPSGL